jgi:hypothetical protein
VSVFHRAGSGESTSVGACHRLVSARQPSGSSIEMCPVGSTATPARAVNRPLTESDTSTPASTTEASASTVRPAAIAAPRDRSSTARSSASPNAPASR